jgi:hypothetical protein
VELTVRTDQPRYATGEPIVVTLTVHNRTANRVVCEFASSQRYDVLLLDAAGDTVWQWSADQAFLQVLGEEAIEPNGSLVYEVRYDGRLPPGRYTVVGRFVTLPTPLEARAALAVT